MLDGDQYTDTPTKILVEDIIREKCCIHLNQELPYIIRQVITVQCNLHTIYYVDIFRGVKFALYLRKFYDFSIYNS